MADVTFTPQFQPPAWRDNVDLVAAEGPRGFNAQFQSLQVDLIALSQVVKQLSDALLNANQTAQATNTTVQALQPTSTVIQAACWGNIRSDGTISSSSNNFTIAKAGAGVYDITFKTAFTALPSVVATQTYPGGDITGSITSIGGSTLDNAVVVGIALSQCRIKVGGSDGVAADRNFGFLVYGPST